MKSKSKNDNIFCDKLHLKKPDVEEYDSINVDQSSWVFWVLIVTETTIHVSIAMNNHSQRKV